MCTLVRAGVTFRRIRVCLSTWMCTSMRVCAWIYVSMRVSARVYAVVHVCEHGHGTRVHACALARAAGLCVQANTSTPAPRTSCCRPQAGTRVCARVTVAPPDPAHGRTDGRTAGAVSPARGSNGSRGKQRTLPAPCGCCGRRPGGTRGCRRVFLRCPAGTWDRTCVPVPGPPPAPPAPSTLGLTQPGAAASQTSRRGRLERVPGRVWHRGSPS